MIAKVAIEFETRNSFFCFFYNHALFCFILDNFSILSLFSRRFLILFRTILPERKFLKQKNIQNICVFLQEAVPLHSEIRSKFFINIANLTNSGVLLRDEATLFLFLKVFLFLAAKGAGVSSRMLGRDFRAVWQFSG